MTAAYGLRDRIACALCNWIMRHVASERYRKMIGGAVSYGLASAVRDDADGREAPAQLWAEAAKAYAEPSPPPSGQRRSALSP